MEITEQIKEHDVTDYDFMFNSGSKLTISVDHDAGDSASELSDRYIVDIAAKPSVTNADELVDAELVTVYKNQLAFVSVRKRKQRMPTEEELLEMRRFTHSLAKLVQ